MAPVPDRGDERRLDAAEMIHPGRRRANGHARNSPEESAAPGPSARPTDGSGRFRPPKPEFGCRGVNASARKTLTSSRSRQRCVAGCRIPERDGTILVGPGERSTIRGKPDRREFLWSRERDAGPGPAAKSHTRTVPSLAAEANCVPSGRRPVAGSCRHDRSDAEALRVFDVPETNRLVRSRRGEQLAIGMKGQRTGTGGVSPERGQAACRWRRPRGGRCLASLR